MVRNYSRKTDRQKWSSECMEQAIAAVIKKEIGLRKAALQFQVPKTTLQRNVKKKIKDDEHRVDKCAGKFRTVFTAEQEQELVDYIKLMESILFGLTLNDCRALAYQLAERNNIEHPFNKIKQLAGADWMQNFLARHSELSLRKPEATSGARAMGFNQSNVQKFFSLLFECVEKYNLTADRIFNCDETGITVNPKGHSKVIAPKGKRQVGVITSSERGERVTAEICFSAAGAYMPPMLIFPRKKKQKEFELGLPPGGWAECHETGWITTDIFTKWFKEFAVFSKASKENVVLLILDGHSTHTKNLQVIDYARENGVVLLCLPPHASHRLQPLDVTFMRPLSLYYEQETRKWLRMNAGKVITLWQVASLFISAFIKAATMETALNGFKSTGIWPPHMSVFKDVDFMPSAPTDKPNPIQPESGTSVQTVVQIPSPKHSGPSVQEEICSADVLPDNLRPQCSWDTPIIITPAIPSTAFPCVTPPGVLSVPKVQTQEKRKTSRKKGKSTILTSSPYKAELETSMKVSKRKTEKQAEKAKKKLNMSLIPTKRKCAEKSKGKKKAAKKNKRVESSGSSEDNSDAECLYCGHLYSQSSEGWIACDNCHSWAHNLCAGVDTDNDEDDEFRFVCEFCQ